MNTYTSIQVNKKDIDANKRITLSVDAEIYWKKQLEGSITKKEEELEKLEKENMRVIEEVYRTLTQDGEILELIGKVRSYEWAKVVKGEGV